MSEDPGDATRESRRTWSFVRGFVAGASAALLVLWLIERYNLFGA